jgi:hypothetical protein
MKKRPASISARRDRRANMLSVRPPPEGGRRRVLRCRTFLKSNHSERGANRRRRPQRPALGCGPAGPSDRRFRLAGTSVGGLLPLRPGVRVPLATSRNGDRSARWRGASGSASTFAIQPSLGVRDCMAATEHQTAYWTVKAPRLSRNSGKAPTGANRVLPGLRPHKKTDRGQTRDRRTVREFQFHE